MSDSELAIPRPRAARLQSPPPRVTTSTPDSIVRLLSDLRLEPLDPDLFDGPVPDGLPVASAASSAEILDSAVSEGDATLR